MWKSKAPRITKKIWNKKKSGGGLKYLMIKLYYKAEFIEIMGY